MNIDKIFSINNLDYFLDRVFLEYEQPELFSVRDMIGRQYIVMLIDEYTEKWLMTPISVKRLCELEYGKISIREAFINPELKFINLIEHNNDKFLSSQILPTDLREEYLPLDEARLNWDNVPMPTSQEEIQTIAKNRERDVFDIRIISESTRDHTIETKIFATFLNIINETLSKLTKARNKRLGKKNNLSNNCTLRCAGIYGGSFGVRLESSELSNFLDETHITPILKDLFDLLQITDVSSIEKIVKEQSFDYSSSLRKLLKFSNDNNAAIEFSFTTPNAFHKGNAYWEQDFSLKALAYLDQLISDEIKDEHYVGHLVSISTKHKNFEFIDDADDIIKGKIDTSLQEMKFIVPSNVKITVKRNIRITKANEIDEKYCLTGIEYLDN